MVMLTFWDVYYILSSKCWSDILNLFFIIMYYNTSRYIVFDHSFSEYWIYDFMYYNRNTTLKVNEESQMNMYLLTIGTHHFDHLMAMCPHMAITHIQASPVIVITTTVIWQMIEDMSHLEIPIFRKSPKRREIETTNPLGVSTQVCHSLFVFNQIIKTWFYEQFDIWNAIYLFWNRNIGRWMFVTYYACISRLVNLIILSEIVSTKASK